MKSEWQRTRKILQAQPKFQMIWFNERVWVIINLPISMNYLRRLTKKLRKGWVKHIKR
jgi:hypothetical protein